MGSVAQDTSMWWNRPTFRVWVSDLWFGGHWTQSQHHCRCREYSGSIAGWPEVGDGNPRPLYHPILPFSVCLPSMAVLIFFFFNNCIRALLRSSQWYPVTTGNQQLMWRTKHFNIWVPSFVLAFLSSHFFQSRCCHPFLKIFKCLFNFWERVSVNGGGAERERGRHRIWSKPHAGLEPMNREIMT